MIDRRTFLAAVSGAAALPGIARTVAQTPRFETLMEWLAASRDARARALQPAVDRIREHLSETYRLHHRLLRTRRTPDIGASFAIRGRKRAVPFIQAIRKNVIVLITPVLEVDGRDRMVDIYNYRKANPGKNAPSLLYWGKYVAHDNNRDGLGMALALTRNMMKTFLEYHPAVLHDLHESVPFLYTSTGTGPYNA